MGFLGFKQPDGTFIQDDPAYTEALNKAIDEEFDLIDIDMDQAG